MRNGIQFPVRFFIDEHFIENITQNKQLATDIFLKLSHIHTNSEWYPSKHNKMFDESFVSCIRRKPLKGQAILGIVNPIPPPLFVSKEKEFTSKVIRYCINMADKKPYQVIILTSKEQSEKYKQDKHYANNKIQSAVKIYYGKEAESFINFVYSNY